MTVVTVVAPRATRAAGDIPPPPPCGQGDARHRSLAGAAPTPAAPLPPSSVGGRRRRGGGRRRERCGSGRAWPGWAGFLRGRASARLAPPRDGAEEPISDDLTVVKLGLAHCNLCADDGAHLVCRPTGTLHIEWVAD